MAHHLALASRASRAALAAQAHLHLVPTAAAHTLCGSRVTVPMAMGFVSQHSRDSATAPLAAAAAERAASGAATSARSPLRPLGRLQRNVHAAVRSSHLPEPTLDARQATELARRLAEMKAATAPAPKPTLALPEVPEVDVREWLKAAKAATAPAPADILTDKFGRRHTYLRISLTERCNLRCTYCMPEEGIDLASDSELLQKDEIVRVAKLFVEAGVDKLRLTGGEPTVRKDLLELAQELGALPGLKTLALTTNGLVLSRQVEQLQKAGLNAVNISLDTLVPAKFELLTRRKGHDRVMNAIERALAVGVETVKVNVVLMRGVNDDEINDFVELTRHKRLNVRFIEYMPFDGNAWETKKMVSYKEIKGTIEQQYGPLHRQADPMTEVAKNYRVPGFAGTVSFITSMTEHFCGGCNRLRIMADGNLKVCLFGPAEVSLRDAMRAGATDEQLRHVVRNAVLRKKESHEPPDVLAVTKNRPMIQIGG